MKSFLLKASSNPQPMPRVNYFVAVQFAAVSSCAFPRSKKPI